jgi:hypothetical protein
MIVVITDGQDIPIDDIIGIERQIYGIMCDW